MATSLIEHASQRIDVTAGFTSEPEGARATVWLGRAARWWAVLAVTSQLLMAVYVTDFYGARALAGRIAAWNQGMPRGYIPGASFGNAVVASHLIGTVAFMVMGAMQLLPGLRRRAPRVHRWSGRVYLLVAAVLAIGGLYLVWVRGGVGGFWQHVGLSCDALAILACGTMALRTARARDIAAHRRWALRLWIAGNAVWFFRLALFLVLMIFRRPVGFDPATFDGPLLIALTFAQSMVPLLVLEGYFAAQRTRRVAARWAMTTVLGVAMLFTVAGTAAVALIAWVPRMHRAIEEKPPT
ncbi:MAG: DUF2306 domain-containing protein [Gemmatimonadaceae bacterium]|jgi:uncharacterized membrane protein|nr:DUF2306 domain-containing protein [Gemmatimonadaceae bacterium]